MFKVYRLDNLGAEIEYGTYEKIEDAVEAATLLWLDRREPVVVRDSSGERVFAAD
jgi:hypothetical protein